MRHYGSIESFIELTMRLLQATGLKKSFKAGKTEAHVLKGVDISIAPGELVALMGPSGSGKSTLLNIIGGLLQADEGHIELNHQEYGTTSPLSLNSLRRESIGWVFQNSNLLDHLTAQDNVAFALTLSGVAIDEAQKIAISTLNQVGLDERVNFYPPQLSAGQAQRVAIARAISGNRSLLLADEPTGNLDITTGKEILHIFQDLCHSRRESFSVLMVTHDPVLASEADRVLLLRDGYIVSDSEMGSAT